MGKFFNCPWEATYWNFEKTLLEGRDISNNWNMYICVYQIILYIKKQVNRTAEISVVSNVLSSIGRLNSRIKKKRKYLGWIRVQGGRTSDHFHFKTANWETKCMERKYTLNFYRPWEGYDTVQLARLFVIRSRKNMVCSMYLLYVCTYKRAQCVAKAVSYTHLDVYKRQTDKTAQK